GFPRSRSPGTRRPGAPDSRGGFGATASLPRRYGGAQGAGGTVVPPTPEGGSADSLPIFDAIESNWFKRRTGGPTVDATETGPIQQVDPSQAPQQSRSSTSGHNVSASGSEQEWNSAADRGWKAARTAAEPLAGGLTTSGLPKRVPK